jgi:outer membrane protein assembly factor BamB
MHLKSAIVDPDSLRFVHEMSALHVVIQPRLAATPSGSLSSVYGLFDVVVDGVNITARIGQVEAMTLLCDFAQSFSRLMVGERPRQSLQLHADLETWELGLERDGQEVLLTVYRERPVSTVAVWERRVSAEDLRRALLAAVDEACQSTGLSERKLSPLRANLVLAQRALQTPVVTTHPRRQLQERRIAPLGGDSFRLGAQLLLRTETNQTSNSSKLANSRLESADLHALLVEGSLAFDLASQQSHTGSSQVFLDAEQLVALCHELWSNVEAARPIFRRASLSSSVLTLRWGPDSDRLELKVRIDDRGRERTLFSELPAREFCSTSATFARNVCQAFVDSDAQQLRNLRLKALQQQAEALLQRVACSDDDETLSNPDPASYRLLPATQRRLKKGIWEQGGKMRFMPRWVATVPGIDLTSTFLCGDRLVIGSNRETACLDRQNGNILWRQRTERARAVVSPSGLLRIAPNGQLSCLDLGTGESRFELQLMPRPHGGYTGSVVDTPGLPKIFAVTEGDRQVTAIDLPSGRVRWRYTAPRATPLRARRAGKLLLVAGKDPTLVALDIASGEVVWRLRQRLPFTGDLVLDRDSIFAVTGAPGGRCELLHIDAWSGNVLWSTELDEKPELGRLPLVTPQVVAIPSRDEHGSGVRAYQRSTGNLLWQHGPGLAAPLSVWLTFDDCILANTAAGVLLCLDANTGAARYSQVFARNAAGDQPRRLEPVLRSGALFVPQQRVHVVRPRDGELLGTLPSDLIPDLIRVDERCDVYVAEESGHIAAFGVAPRLTLIKS